MYPGASAPALVDIDLSIDVGQFVGIVGANGSGKSTLARLLNGLLRPVTGTVWLQGRPASDAVALRTMKKRIGLVFQNPDNWFVAPTLEDDVAFGPENFGLPPDEIGRRVHEALELVGLVHARAKSPSDLSGGQKQLAALAGALAQQPDCIVLDEGTALLDPGGRRLVVETLLRLVRRRGLLGVMITHQTDDLVKADRIVALDRGKIAFDGPPAALWDAPELIEQLGLELPAVVRILRGLRVRGIDVKTVYPDISALAESLCPSS